MSEEDRKKRDKRHRISILNVCTVLLAALKSMPPLEEGGDRGSATPSRHNIDLPWVSTARCDIVYLLLTNENGAKHIKVSLGGCFLRWKAMLLVMHVHFLMVLLGRSDCSETKCHLIGLYLRLMSFDWSAFFDDICP